jgi:tRNA(fMet)-specific endonuclease VapC
MDFVLKADSKENLLRAQQHLTRAEELLEQIFIITIDANTANIFDQLRADSSLRKIGRADLLIASIACKPRYACDSQCEALQTVSEFESSELG